ncbi:MAG: ABC transporter substrate-binding protein [Candidatus Rokubacteria bacterium]|nr:ABC transporter substrate-binding protein [Candidatus Rokubacteria bacterium]
MGHLTRRGFLRLGVGAAGTAAVAGVPGVLRAQSREVVMLGLWPFTGAFADVGPILDRGMKMALDERGMKIQGKPIKYITRDSATQAGAATRRAEEAADSESVKYIIGPWSSGVALAVSEVAKRKKVLHYFSGGTEDIAGARCHRYSFQWAASPYTAAKTVVDNFMKANPRAKRWHLLVADYAFGWSVEKYIKEIGKSHGLEFVGADRHPLGEREFSNYVTKAAGNKPDVVAMINFGLDTVTAAREIFNFGLTPKIPLILSWSSGVEELVQLSPEMRENMWVGSNFYFTADTPVAKEFVKSYQAKFGGPPGYAPSAAYGMTRMVLHGMDKAKSTDHVEVIKALEGIEVDDLVGRMRVDPKTHQTLRPFFFMRCKKKGAMKHAMDFADIIATGTTPLPAEYSACKDIGTL